MKLSCIVTTRNRREEILRTIEHLEQRGVLPEDREILVVDNGSTDGTAQALSRRRGVQVFSLAENEGVPARNIALTHARGKYVAFLGDDVRPMGRAVPEALTYLSRRPKTAAVVGRIVSADGSADAPALPAVLMGGASIVRKSVLDQVGGFASEFFRQAADYELSFRIWRAGYSIQRFEDLLFAREAPSDERTCEIVCRMDLRNNLILCERYLPRPLRHAYRRDWMKRYSMLSREDGHAQAANVAVKEARIWARREAAVGRRPLGPEAIESIFQLRAQGEAVASWAKANKVRRVWIADWGKNLYATWQACVSAGLSVEAVLENDRAFAGARYRTVPIMNDAAAVSGGIEGILVSTLNPGQVDGRVAELQARFGLPVLRLWTPSRITVPPPTTLAGESGTTRRSIDRAA
ncbi:MAG TPA: glycosyltransferase [Tepidisphaeraceae bacterium]|nr:glycosyltransferase [Tepidisphaeraceae bacterium]